MLKVGQTYTREQVQRAVGAPVQKGGPWATGYTEFEGAAYVFANVGTAGRTGHDYDNYWDGDRLHWKSKLNARRGQRRIENMLTGRIPVHMFVRRGDRQPFTYAGIAVPVGTSGEAPVSIEWSFATGRPSMPLSADEIAAGFAALGFSLGEVGSKSQKITGRGFVFYLKRDTNPAPLVLEPRWEEALSDITDIPGIWRTERREFFYHQSMLLEFPLRRHTGKTDTHFGLDFEVNSLLALGQLVECLLQWSGRRALPIETLAEQPDPRTETESRRAARLGQTKFRNDLLNRWRGKCALTGVAMPEMIRASHIKPWRDSTPKERLDPDNGLPLLVHIDLLFDKGAISFSDAGDILVADRLLGQQLDVFGVRRDMRIEGLSVGNRDYLKHHRERFFPS